jgi:hypothetical protein
MAPFHAMFDATGDVSLRRTQALLNDPDQILAWHQARLALHVEDDPVLADLDEAIQRMLAGFDIPDTVAGTTYLQPLQHAFADLDLDLDLADATWTRIFHALRDHPEDDDLLHVWIAYAAWVSRVAASLPIHTYVLISVVLAALEYALTPLGDDIAHRLDYYLGEIRDMISPAVRTLVTTIAQPILEARWGLHDKLRVSPTEVARRRLTIPAHRAPLRKYKLLHVRDGFTTLYLPEGTLLFHGYRATTPLVASLVPPFLETSAMLWHYPVPTAMLQLTQFVGDRLTPRVKKYNTLAIFVTQRDLCLEVPLSPSPGALVGNDLYPHAGQWAAHRVQGIMQIHETNALQTVFEHASADTIHSTRHAVHPAIAPIDRQSRTAFEQLTARSAVVAAPREHLSADVPLPASRHIGVPEIVMPLFAVDRNTIVQHDLRQYRTLVQHPAAVHAHIDALRAAPTLGDWNRLAEEYQLTVRCEALFRVPEEPDALQQLTNLYRQVGDFLQHHRTQLCSNRQAPWLFGWKPRVRNQRLFEPVRDIHSYAMDELDASRAYDPDPQIAAAHACALDTERWYQLTTAAALPPTVGGRATLRTRRKAEVDTPEVRVWGRMVGGYLPVVVQVSLSTHRKRHAMKSASTMVGTK